MQLVAMVVVVVVVVVLEVKHKWSTCTTQSGTSAILREKPRIDLFPIVVEVP
jgi:hypothetical protein